uniref:tRNA dimethylallyltransferase n=2 Tax=Chloropicon primus TaxID=1764295 RepID=A0A7S2T402_9CHLO|mmetsp:Transcript_4097/g.11901  ORF Transcript_4097/g.11901 Transcript_4097/m.11901 type:complete len:489 (+) Transcript_4097:648-2114(+)
MMMETSKKWEAGGKVLVILGATGTGKTKVAIEVAQALRDRHGISCEVINCDVLQCYSGSPIVTNKATPEEQRGVRHHLIGFADPRKDFTTQEYRIEAQGVLEDLRKRNVLPILCGGSDYYAKALLSRHFDLSQVTTAPGTAPGDGGGGGEDEDDDALESNEAPPSRPDADGADLEDKYKQLQEVDPISAAWLHPNNTRRIRRYLDIYETTGVPASELFKRQRVASKTKGSTLLYHCCVFFLDADDSVLAPHLRARVGAMIERGMEEELTDLYARCHPDTERGIFQAIGVKEFRHVFSPGQAEEAGREDRGSGEMIEEGVEEMKKNTIRLAKRQRRRVQRWVSDQAIGCSTVDMTGVIRSKLEASSGNEDAGRSRQAIWKEEVMDRVLPRVESFLTKRSAATEGETAPAEAGEETNWRTYQCSVCNGRVFRGPLEWESHRNSRAHRKRMSKLRKQNKPAACTLVEAFLPDINRSVFSLSTKSSNKQQQG